MSEFSPTEFIQLDAVEIVRVRTNGKFWIADRNGSKHHEFYVLHFTPHNPNDVIPPEVSWDVGRGDMESVRMVYLRNGYSRRILRERVKAIEMRDAFGPTEQSTE